MELSANSLARGLNESIRANEKNKTELDLLNLGWKQVIRDEIKELEEKTVIAQGEELLIIEAKIDMLEEIIGE